MANKAIEKFTSAIAVLKKVYAELPIQQIILFLEVAKQEGITMPELMKLTDMPQGSLSRNVKALSVYLKADPEHPEKRSKAGHELLDTRQDMANRKSLALYLTPKGKKIIKQIEQAIESGA